MVTSRWEPEDRRGWAVDRLRSTARSGLDLRRRVAGSRPRSQECRALNLRLAELTDIVTELLLPVAAARRGEAGRAAREVPPERLSHRPMATQVYLHIGLPEDRHDLPPVGALGIDGERSPRRASCCRAAVTASTCGPPSSCRSGRTSSGAHPRRPARWPGWSRRVQPASGTGRAHPRVLLRRRPGAGRAALVAVAGARPRCTSSSPPATPSACSTAGLGGVRQERRHQAARRDARRPARRAGAEFGWRTWDLGGVLRRWGPARPSRAGARRCRCPDPARRATSTGATSPAVLGLDPDRYDAPDGAPQPGPRRRPDRAAAPGQPAPDRRSARPSTAAPGSAATSPRATWSARTGERLGADDEQVAECRERADRAVRIIRRRGYHVVGDVESLRVPADLPTRPRPDDVSNAALLESATTLVADMLADVRRIAREGPPDMTEGV